MLFDERTRDKPLQLLGGGAHRAPGLSPQRYAGLGRGPVAASELRPSWGTARTLWPSALILLLDISACQALHFIFMDSLTKPQQRVLSFLESFITKNGYPPSRKQIAEKMGFASQNAAQDHLKALAKKGRIELTPAISCGLKLTGGALKASKGNSK